MFRSYCVFCVLLLGTTASSHTLKGDIKGVAKSFDKCGKSYDLSTCLRLKAVSLLDEALTSRDSIAITDFLSLSPDLKVLENGNYSKEDDIERVLVENPEKKDEKLDDMIADRMARYLNSRSLQFHLPADLAVESGRGKKDKDGKKGGMMMMAAVAMGGMMMHMMMGKVAMIAGKALIVGKVALVLSILLALKKMGGGGGGDSHPQVIYASESHGGGGGGHGGGWGRSIIEERDAADRLAYRGLTTGPGATAP